MTAKRQYLNVKIPKYIHHTQFAEFLDLSSNWLRRLNSVEKCLTPLVGEPGVYCFPESVRSYIKFLKKRKEPGMMEEKLRLTRAQTERIELDNEVSIGELLPFKKSKETFGQILTDLRSEFLSMSGRLANEFAACNEAAEIKAIHDREIRETLNYAAKKLEGIQKPISPVVKSKSAKKRFSMG